MKEELQIIVCLKQVADPEGPPSAFEVDSEAKRVIPRGIPPVISPFDENALEAALGIKDAHRSRVTVISMGDRLALPVLRKALAAGADDLIMLQDESFAPEKMDSYSTACSLAAAIKKVGQYDLIFTGRQAADWNAGQVGLGIAEILGIPGISLARKVTLEGEGVRVERVLPDGYEVIKVQMPVLITASNEVGDLRYPKIRDLVEARKKPVTTWQARDIGIPPVPIGRQSRLVKLFAPQGGRQCNFIEGENPAEAGANLALKLREDKVI